MANLVRARSWGQVKPPPGAEIDWGHPLSQALAFCALLNELAPPLDLVTGQRGVITNGPLAYQRLGNQGIGFASASSQSISWTGYTGPAKRTPPTGVSAAGAAWYASTGYPVGTVFSTIATSRGFRIGLNNNGGVVASAQDNIGAGSVKNGAFINQPINRDFTVAGSYTASGNLKVYRNGHLDGTLTGQTTQLLSPTGVPQIGVSTMNGGVGYAYYWLRELTGDEVAWLTVEPYAFIAPPGPKVLYFAMGKPAATFSTTGAISGHGVLAGSGVRTQLTTGAITGHGTLAGGGVRTALTTGALSGHGILSGSGAVTSGPTTTNCDHLNQDGGLSLNEDGGVSLLEGCPPPATTAAGGLLGRRGPYLAHEDRLLDRRRDDEELMGLL